LTGNVFGVLFASSSVKTRIIVKLFFSGKLDFRRQRETQPSGMRPRKSISRSGERREAIPFVGFVRQIAFVGLGRKKLVDAVVVGVSV
jgi:hypothetical protein